VGPSDRFKFSEMMWNGFCPNVKNNSYIYYNIPVTESCKTESTVYISIFLMKLNWVPYQVIF
jgi:hypothetical protein